MFVKSRSVRWCVGIALALSVGVAARLAADGDDSRDDSRARRVLLISIDGIHALDFEIA
jgi:hypothetical protein